MGNIAIYALVFISYFYQHMTTLLHKYEDIIKEEVNIKHLEEFDSSIVIQKTFKPIGSQLSAKFGKDTGQIIQLGKQGNIKDIGEGKVIIFDAQGHEWTLEKTDYEIAYEWLEGSNIAIDQDIIAKLDLELTPELEREGIAREISRFLNQMRKDADYRVDTKVQLLFATQDKALVAVVEEFSDFFKHEALISDIQLTDSPTGDIVALFTSGESTINFALKK